MTLVQDELAYHIFIQATAQDVWDALAGPGWTRKYGYRTLVKYDSQPGGTYLAYASGRRYGQRAGDLIISGEVLEAEPPTRLTWEVAGSGGWSWVLSDLKTLLETGRPLTY